MPHGMISAGPIKYKTRSKSKKLAALLGNRTQVGVREFVNLRFYH